MLPSRRLDLAQGHLALVHAGDRIVAVGRQRVDAFAAHDGVFALGIFPALTDAWEPAGEVERHERDALADTVGDQRLDAGLRAVFRTEYPDPAAVLDAALGGVRRIDLDEHILLQLGEPAVRPGFLAAALIFHQTSRGQDDRELLGKSLVHRRLLDREAEIGHAELAAVRTRRIFGDEFRTRGVDRLAMNRHRIGQIPRHRAGLAAAIRHHALLQRDADDAARQVDGPNDAVGIVAADLVDG